MAVIERSFLLELPEDIIFHILSYITNRERLRLGLTSKPLLSSVRKCPNLALSDHRIIQDEGNIDHVKRYRQELKYILSTLTRYDRDNIQLETFTLQPKYVRNAPHDRCIKLAEKRGVRNLKLRMRECTRAYGLPESVFRVESLVELELRRCIIEPKDRKIAWPNLKRLKVIESCSINQEAFENIISGCPKIENLTVDWVLFDVKLGNLRNLKQLDIKINAKRCLEVINTPNLESMSCFNHGTVNFGDDEYLSLKSLDLHLGGIDEHLFTNFARKFPKLENLHLNCNSSPRINLSSASLKKLKLSGNDWEEVCFDVPNLIYFEYWGKIIRKLSFAGNSGRWISSIELLETGNKVDATWFRELTEFLAALNKSETSVSVKLMRSVAISLNHEEVRTIADSATPIHGIISEFSINTNLLKKSTKSSSARALLDFILLVCQPQTVKFLDCKSSKYQLPWHFYEILSSQDRGGVTDFEMVQRSSSNYREESRLSSSFKNWDTKVWEVLNASKEFIFNLEYGSENLHMKKKRKLDVPCWTSREHNKLADSVSNLLDMPCWTRLLATPSLT